MEAFLSGAAEQDPTGLTGLLPNGDGFRYYSVTSSVPRKGAGTYRLTVDGLVDRPATYTLADLRALPQTRMVRDVQCVTGWRVPGTPFEGVRLSRLLDAAGTHPRPARCASPASTAPTRRASPSNRRAARERGPGTAWTVAHLTYEREMADLLGIPFDNTVQVALTPIAYTIGTDFKPAPRADDRKFSHWNRW